MIYDNKASGFYWERAIVWAVEESVGGHNAFRFLASLSDEDIGIHAASAAKILCTKPYKKFGRCGNY
jgi:hypothetical protein